MAASIPLAEAVHLCRQQLPPVPSFWTITLKLDSIIPEMQPGRTTMTFLERIMSAIDDPGALAAFE